MSNDNNMDRKRRSFIRNSGLALIGTSLAYQSGLSAQSSNTKKATLKVGLIGCGGRGTGAAVQALRADPDVVLTAMGDVFEDRLNASHEELMKEVKEKMQVSN
jgi:myo-inositol 2-dehydrogenase / D-chiro-inositol 1-dehydrogenase